MAGFILRGALLLQAVGAAWLWTRDGSYLGIEVVQAVFAVLFGAGVLVGARRTRFFEMALVGLAVVFGLEAIAATIAKPLELFEQAVRFGAPVALLLYERTDRRRFHKILSYAVVAVFAAHGLKALVVTPQFVDYLRVSILRTSSFVPSIGTVSTLVFAIGVVDVALAVLLLFRRSRAALAYMAIWGFLTAGMRLIYFGPAFGAALMLLRALNGAAPLALLLADGASEAEEAERSVDDSIVAARVGL